MSNVYTIRIRFYIIQYMMAKTLTIGSLIKKEVLEENGLKIVEPAGATTGAKLVIVENVNNKIKYVFEQLPDEETFKVY